VAISRLIDFGKQVWNVRARSEETKRPTCPANTDLKYVVVKRSTCKGAIAARPSHTLGFSRNASYPRPIACAPLGVLAQSSRAWSAGIFSKHFA